MRRAYPHDLTAIYPPFIVFFKVEEIYLLVFTVPVIPYLGFPISIRNEGQDASLLCHS